MMKAKTKITKLWSILLALVMLVGLLPTTALAAEPATTTADFTSGDGSAALALLNTYKTGETDSTWVGTTLTLNGVNFTTTAAIAVKLPHGSTIVLPDGTTNIIKSENSNNSTQSCGIYLEEDTSGTKGDLTIKIPDGSTGTGKLTVTGGAATEYSQGIRLGSGKVTISGGIVEATGGTAASSSEGILAQKGLAISGNAKVTAIGGSGSSNSYGIYGSSNTSKVEISDNADVTAISAAASNNSYGIYIYSAVNITGGTVKCSAGAASYSYGIYGNRAVNITGGTVKCSAGAASYSSRSYGIFSIKNVNIDSAEVTATGKHDAINIYEGSLTTSNVKNISFDANSGTGAMQAYTNVATYTLPANGFTAPSNKVFKGWKVGEEIKKVGDTINVSGSSTTVYAQWGDAEYAVTVTNGTASPSGAQVAGTSVTITANAPAAGKQFKEWTGADGLTFTSGSKTSATATFTMPNRAVALIATYEDIPVTEYNINVTNGTASVSKAAAGTTVTLTANTAPSGQVFDKWEVVSGGITLADATSATTTFTMPAGDVSVKATYHTHSYGSEWKSNADKHWHECSCGDKSEEAAHTASDWIIDQEATSGTNGSKHKECTICLRVMETVTIPATGGSSSYTPPTYKVESEVSKDADGSVSFSKSSAKKGDAVTITVTPDRYYKVDGVTVKDKNGKEIAVTDNGDGTFTFKMPDSKVAVEPVFSWDNPFTDVAENTYYTPAVEWALKNDVTGGTTAATFSPNTGCTRAQIVTFLWRAAGCPEPAGANSFTDVSADAYYAKAVAWAVEQGITNGTGDGKFSPDAVCTRSQSMAFIYRSEQAQGGGMQGEWMFLNPFADVNLDDYYGEAVMWAVANGVTSGTSDTTFSPNATCTRGQIVTFLYRFFVK